MSEKTARDEEVKAAAEIITNELVTAGLIDVDEFEEKMQRLGGQLQEIGEKMVKAVEAVTEAFAKIAKTSERVSQTLKELRKEPEGRDVFRRIYKDDAGTHRQGSEIRTYKEARNQRRARCVRRVQEKKWRSDSRYVHHHKR